MIEIGPIRVTPDVHQVKRHHRRGPSTVMADCPDIVTIRIKGKGTVMARMAFGA